MKTPPENKAMQGALGTPDKPAERACDAETRERKAEAENKAQKPKETKSNE